MVLSDDGLHVGTNGDIGTEANALFLDSCVTLMPDVIGTGMPDGNAVDNRRLIDVNAEIRSHSVEVVGARLRGYMTGMKAISSAD